MPFLKKAPKKILGMRVSSIIPLFLNITALLFYIAGLAASVYKDNSVEHSLWYWTNKTTNKETWFEFTHAPCEDYYTRINIAKIYSIAAIIFCVVTIIVNTLDVFNRPVVSKGHGILTVATAFLGVIAFTITISLMSFSVCKDQQAPLNNAGFQYGAAQPIEVIAVALSFTSAFFIYAF